MNFELILVHHSLHLPQIQTIIIILSKNLTEINLKLFLRYLVFALKY